MYSRNKNRIYEIKMARAKLLSPFRIHYNVKRLGNGVKRPRNGVKHLRNGVKRPRNGVKREKQVKTAGKRVF